MDTGRSYNYRILADEALSDPASVSTIHRDPTPIPQQEIIRILDTLRAMRIASINLVNGMVSMIFSCDGIHYLSNEKFLIKNI